MSKITLTTEVEITNSQAQDVLVAALEGGIGYWAVALSIQDIRAPGANFIDGYESFTIVEEEEYLTDEANAPTFFVDADKVREGIKNLHGLILAGKVHPNSEIGKQFLHHLFSSDEGIEYVDSVVADAIIQAALFNEIRYG
jgi:hypothetical protein